MNWAIYIDVAVGLAFSLAVLVMAIFAGREPAAHQVVWIVGLVLLALRALFSVAVGVGVMVASGGMWAFALGALALVLVIPIAYLRPRWAGIVLLVTAVVQPLLLLVLNPVAGERDAFPVEVMLGFYTVTAAVIGAVLIASTLRWGRGQEPDEPAVGVMGEAARQR